jgi:hypothetical protein
VLLVLDADVGCVVNGKMGFVPGDCDLLDDLLFDANPCYIH